MTSHVGDRTTAASTTAASAGEAPVDDSRPRLGLAIAWSTHAPARAGEVAFISDTGTMRLGRGDDRDGDAVVFSRARAGRCIVTGPVREPGISRRQLLIRARPDALAVENVGRCPLLVNGTVSDKSIVVPGDTLLLKGQLLMLVVARAAQLPEHRSYPGDALGEFGQPDRLGILGESPVAERMREDIGFAARAIGHVLVQGESGTGKELAARAIHALSQRGSGPLVARNAATFPSGLIDAELFGNVKNYPHAGMAERKGLIGEADGGTLFLDEIGELPTDLQSHLLRVLDADGEYQRLGESSTRRADVRVIGATHRDPSALRHDLAGRLKIRIEVPALAARREDIPLLVRHLLSEAERGSPELLSAFERDAAGMVALEAELVEHLTLREYTGNVRELEALLWRAMQTSKGRKLALTEAVKAREPAAGSTAAAAVAVQPLAENLAQLEVTERELVEKAMKEAGGNQSKAARLLGISRIVLRRRLERYAIGRG